MKQIHYAPISGALAAYDTETREWSDCAIEEFQHLRAAEDIVFHRTMRQGHSRFHGRVDIYRFTDVPREG